MNIKKDLLDKEIEQWMGFYNNDESLLDNILVDVLAHYTKEQREEKIKAANDLLESLQAPINVQQALDSIKSDVESYDRIKNEAGIALRTLNWIKDIEDKEVECEPDKPEKNK